MRTTAIGTPSTRSESSAIAQTGTGQIVRTGTGEIERTGTGSARRGGWLAVAACLVAMTFSSGAMAADQSFSIGSFMVTTHNNQVAVSWHRTVDKSMTLLQGFAKLENGFALIDLIQTDLLSGEKAMSLPWGQVELQLDDGVLSGSITPYAERSEYQFESSNDATYLLPIGDSDRSRLKVEGHGTGSGGGGD